MGENNKGEGRAFRNFVTGVVIGSVVGSLTALLLAPKSGRELRKDIESQANIVLDKTGEVKDTLVEKSGQWKEQANDAAIKLTEAVKTQTKEIVDKVQQVKREHIDSPEKVLEDAKEKIAKLSKEIDELQASKK